MQEPTGAFNPLRRLAPVLRCPICGAPLEVRGPDLRCVGPVVHGWGPAHEVPDLAPGVAGPPTIAQAVMEHRGVARIYEARFRPAITRLVGGVTYAEEDAWLAAHLRPVDGPVLDLACGTGRVARWLARMLGVGRVLGVDLSRAMLERARQPPADPGLTYLRASAQALPVGDDALGAVTSFGALHLFPDPPAAVREVGRVLRSGGGFVGMTVTPGPGAWQAVVQAAARVGGVRPVGREELADWLDAAELVPRAWHAQGAFLLFAAVRRSRGSAP